MTLSLETAASMSAVSRITSLYTTYHAQRHPTSPFSSTPSEVASNMPGKPCTSYAKMRVGGN